MPIEIEPTSHEIFLTIIIGSKTWLIADHWDSVLLLVGKGLLLSYLDYLHWVATLEHLYADDLLKAP